MPLHMASDVIIQPTTMELFAANGSRIDVMGMARLNLTVKGMPLSVDVLISRDVDECMLGYDFLVQHSCRCLFDKVTLVLEGLPIKLKSRPARVSLRRVYVREAIRIPTDKQVNVPGVTG